MSSIKLVAEIFLNAKDSLLWTGIPASKRNTPASVSRAVQVSFVC